MKFLKQDTLMVLFSEDQHHNDVAGAVNYNHIQSAGHISFDLYSNGLDFAFSGRSRTLNIYASPLQDYKDASQTIAFKKGSRMGFAVDNKGKFLLYPLCARSRFESMVGHYMTTGVIMIDVQDNPDLLGNTQTVPVVVEASSNLSSNQLDNLHYELNILSCIDDYSMIN